MLHQGLRAALQKVAFEVSSLRRIPQIIELVRVTAELVQLALPAIGEHADAMGRGNQRANAHRALETQVGALLVLLDQHGIAATCLDGTGRREQRPALHAINGRNPGPAQDRSGQVQQGRQVGARGSRAGMVPGLSPDARNPDQALVVQGPFQHNAVIPIRSPWSVVNTTTVLASAPHARRVCIKRPTQSSMLVIIP